MLNLKKIFSLLVIVNSFLFVSCATNSVALQNASRGIGKVAYANATTDNFYRMKVGTTIFNNKSESAKINGLAEAAGAKHISLLRRKFGNRFVSFNVEDSQVTKKGFLGNSYNARDYKKIKESSLAKAKKTGATILFLYEQSEHTPPGLSSSIKLKGYSQFTNSFMGMSRTVCVAANSVSVYDVKTGKAITPSFGSVLSGAYGEYGKKVNGVKWKESFESYTNTEKQKLKNAVLADSERQLQQKLKGLKL